MTTGRATPANMTAARTVAFQAMAAMGAPPAQRVAMGGAVVVDVLAAGGELPAGVAWHDRDNGHASFSLGLGGDCMWRWTTRGACWRDVVHVLEGMARALHGLHGREEVGVAFTEGDLRAASIAPLRFEAVGAQVDVVTPLGRRRTGRDPLVAALTLLCDDVVARICETGAGDAVAIAWMARRRPPQRRTALAGSPPNPRLPQDHDAGRFRRVDLLAQAGGLREVRLRA